MKKYFKKSLLYFILIVFVFSANGIIIYNYLCACNNESYQAIMFDRDCCNQPEKKAELADDCCKKNIKYSQEPEHKKKCKKKYIVYKIPSFFKINDNKTYLNQFSYLLKTCFVKKDNPLLSNNKTIYNSKEKPDIPFNIILFNHVFII